MGREPCYWAFYHEAPLLSTQAFASPKSLKSQESSYKHLGFPKTTSNL
jgi:hypothetical protein